MPKAVGLKTAATTRQNVYEAHIAVLELLKADIEPRNIRTRCTDRERNGHRHGAARLTASKSLDKTFRC